MDMKNLLVGYGRADITPDQPAPMGGYGTASKRLHETVLDPLYATCVAITDAQDNTLLLFSQDIIRSHKDYVDAVRVVLKKELGVPGENVIVCGTHSHSTPDIGITLKTDSWYYKIYERGILEAAKAAMADRQEAQIWIGRGEIKGMNFVRHYVQEGGLYCGANFGYYDVAPIIGHCSEADPQFQAIKFVREGRKDILMLNWQAHACNTGGMWKTDLSADYIGHLRAYMEKTLDVDFIYFQGAAGNLVTKSRIPGEMSYDPEKDVYGEEVAKQVIPQLNNMRRVSGGLVRTAKTVHNHPVNHTEDHLVEAAKEVSAFWKETNDNKRSKKFAEERGINSIYHAAAIVRKAGMTEAPPIEISAAGVGDISFACAPYEMFCENGIEIKEGTPFEMTFINGYCNGSGGYLPTRKAFEYSCYEANTTNYAPGIGEALAQKFVDMLKEIKA